MGKVRLKEIARLAGVSISTVSRVVNEPEQVNPETREQIYRVMRELEYQPGFKTDLRQDKGILAVVTPYLYTEFAMDLIISLEEELRPHGLYPLLINTSEEFSLSTFLSRDSRWADLADMAVLVNMEVDDRAHAFLDGKGVHCATVHSRCPYYFSVLNNNYLGGFDAAGYLWGRGYRRPGVVRWGEACTGPQGDRVTGFLKSLGEKGLNTEEIPCETSAMSTAGGAASTERLLKQYKPDVLFFTSDTMAIGGLEYCREKGIAVPGELAIMGFDDIRMASSMNLTTMKQFIPAKAKSVVDHLIRTRDSVLPPEYPEEVTMTPVLIERQTT